MYANDEEDYSDLAVGLRALDESKQDYVTAEDYFNGTTDMLVPDPRLRQRMAQSGYGQCFYKNLAKTPVTALAQVCRVSNVVTDSESATEALRLIRKNNSMVIEESNIHLKTFMYGDSYAIVWPDEDGEVQISYNSPLCTRVIYDEEHVNRPKYAIKRWQVGKKWRVDLYYPDRVERYITGEKTALGQQGWEEYTEDGQDAVLDNPYGVLPVFHFKTTHNKPEHYDGYSSQDSVNKVSVAHMAAVDTLGFPQLWAILESNASLEGGVDNLPGSFTVDDVDETNSKTRSAARPEPASMTFFEKVKEVGQWQVASTDSFIKSVELEMKMMSQTTTTPMRFFDETVIHNLSGVAIREADAPFKSKAADRKLLLEATWVKLYTFALQVAGVSVSEVDVQWQPDGVYDDPESWAVVKAKQEAGVPQATTLEEANYSPDVVATWTDGSAEEVTLDKSIERLGKMAEAIKNLSLAVGNGVLEKSQVDALIAKVMRDSNEE